ATAHAQAGGAATTQARLGPVHAARADADPDRGDRHRGDVPHALSAAGLSSRLDELEPVPPGVLGVEPTPLRQLLIPAHRIPGAGEGAGESVEGARLYGQ